MTIFFPELSLNVDFEARYVLAEAFHSSAGLLSLVLISGGLCVRPVCIHIYIYIYRTHV